MNSDEVDYDVNCLSGGVTADMILRINVTYVGIRFGFAALLKKSRDYRDFQLRKDSSNFV